MKCSRCGHDTKGTREGDTEYCTTCGGVLGPAHTLEKLTISNGSSITLAPGDDPAYRGRIEARYNEGVREGIITPLDLDGTDVGLDWDDMEDMSDEGDPSMRDD